MLLAFLTRERDGSKWLVSGSDCFVSGKTIPLYELHRKLDGSQSRSGSGGEENNLLPSLPELERMSS
jgi:hypothetical protein